MTRIITAIAFALSLGFIASTASAMDKVAPTDLSNPFPVYTTING